MVLALVENADPKPTQYWANLCRSQKVTQYDPKWPNWVMLGIFWGEKSTQSNRFYVVLKKQNGANMSMKSPSSSRKNIRKILRFLFITCFWCLFLLYVAWATLGSILVHSTLMSFIILFSFQLRSYFVYESKNTTSVIIRINVSALAERRVRARYGFVLCCVVLCCALLLHWLVNKIRSLQIANLCSVWWLLHATCLS